MPFIHLDQLLAESQAILADAKVDSPKLSAQVLAAHVLKQDRVFMLLDRQQQVDGDQAQTIRELVTRRAKGEPVAYLVGEQEFYGLPFAVNPDVLVPRPETELLVELAVQWLRERDCPVFADLGTGSGCIATAVASEVRDSTGVYLDLSRPALVTARKNATANGVGQRLQAVHGSMLALPFAHESLDCIVANPPYVTAQEYDELSSEVADYEPRLALTPGGDGLCLLDAIAGQSGSILKPGGLLLMEYGWKQGRAVHDLVQATGCFGSVEIIQDLAGLDRHIRAIRL